MLMELLNALPRPQALGSDPERAQGAPGLIRPEVGNRAGAGHGPVPVR